MSSPQASHLFDIPLTSNSTPSCAAAANGLAVICSDEGGGPSLFDIGVKNKHIRDFPADSPDASAIRCTVIHDKREVCFFGGLRFVSSVAIETGQRLQRIRCDAEISAMALMGEDERWLVCATSNGWCLVVDASDANSFKLCKTPIQVTCAVGGISALECDDSRSLLAAVAKAELSVFILKINSEGLLAQHRKIHHLSVSPNTVAWAGSGFLAVGGDQGLASLEVWRVDGLIPEIFSDVKKKALQPSGGDGVIRSLRLLSNSDGSMQLYATMIIGKSQHLRGFSIGSNGRISSSMELDVDIGSEIAIFCRNNVCRDVDGTMTVLSVGRKKGSNTASASVWKISAKQQQNKSTVQKICDRERSNCTSKEDLMRVLIQHFPQLRISAVMKVLSSVENTKRVVLNEQLLNEIILACESNGQ